MKKNPLPSSASLLRLADAANGVPMKRIRDWLGHLNMSLMANVYSHVDSRSKLISAKISADVLGG